MENEANIVEEVIETEDFTKESLKYYDKINRKIKISTISFLIILATLFFRRYRDFDVALTSNLFIGLLAIAFIYTIYLLTLVNKRKTSLEIEVVSKELKRHNEIFDVVSIIPIFIAVVTFLNAFILSPATVVKTSMEPNYHEGDNIIVYHMNVSYDRYDVVIMKHSANDYYIKRVIGLPGETITIKNGEIYIDDELLNDPTILKEGAATYCSVGYNIDTTEECSYVIPDGEYFLIGDNREASSDSRSFGSISEEDLYGKVIIKLNIFN